MPEFREEVRFRYLGVQKIHNVETDVIALAQIPGRSIPGFIKMEAHTLPMLQQGFAWIDRETGHILKIRTELLAPIPEIEMQQLTSSIEFSAVHITGVHEIFWLPRQVDVRMNWHQRCGGELHKYSNYRLFTATIRILPQ
ncbi:hypothetical protein [Terriglobus albidus]|uniref:hypothetical protein n=1 Tax=Terriglobus albidus TaxID=1592106 RepID=UPI0021E0F2C5|nr:hypothetical protein [Terriglobus albidus]